MGFARTTLAAALIAAGLAGCTGSGGPPDGAVSGTGSAPTDSMRARGAGPVRQPVIYRPATGGWYFLRQFGAAGPIADDKFTYGGDPSDQPVHGDFDGDGSPDLGLFRRSTGRWFMLTDWTSSGPAADLQLVYGGAPTDVPMPGDFDNDGRDDPAVYRAETGQWFLLTDWSGAQGSIADLKLRLGTDLAALPVVGDFDGDGRDDIGTFSPRTGQWLLDTTLDGVADASFTYGGDLTDVPVAGDFDGNGVEDVGLYRRSNGMWYLLTGRTGSTITGDVQIRYGGDPSDLPVVGDYNGDGSADPAVYRRGTGMWYLLTGRSGNTPTSDFQFVYGGDPTDLPVTTAAVYDMVPRRAMAATEYLYAPGYRGISGQRILRASGALQLLSPTPVAGPSFGDNGYARALADPSGRFLYGINEGDRVHGFTIDAGTGLLTEMTGSPFLLNIGFGYNSFGGAIDPSGSFLYMPLRRYSPSNSTSSLMAAFRIDATAGTLSHLAGSPLAVSGASMDADFQGSRLYTYLDPNRNLFVQGYSIYSGTGQPTPLPGSPYAAGPVMVNMVFEGQGYAYSISTVTETNTSRLHGYSVAADGSLEPLTGFPQTIADGSARLACDPVSATLYAGAPGGQILAWAVSADGSVTPRRGSPFTVSVPRGFERPISFDLDSTGQVLYATIFSQPGLVAAWIVGPDGFLTPVPGSPFQVPVETPNRLDIVALP